MHVLRVFLLPCVFLIGLAFFTYKLSDFLSADTPCAVGSCPRTLREGDSEKVFMYTVPAQFSVTLDERKNPYKNLDCNPRGVIESVSFAAEPPLYTSVFRAIAPGACALESNTFSAMIVIE